MVKWPGFIYKNLQPSQYVYKTAMPKKTISIWVWCLCLMLRIILFEQNFIRILYLKNNCTHFILKLNIVVTNLQLIRYRFFPLPTHLFLKEEYLLKHEMSWKWNPTLYINVNGILFVFFRVYRQQYIDLYQIFFTM